MWFFTVPSHEVDQPGCLTVGLWPSVADFTVGERFDDRTVGARWVVERPDRP